MDVLLSVVTDGPDPGPPLTGQLAAWAGRRGVAGLNPGAAAAAIRMWSRLHGLVSLEIEGNFASMGLDADALFAAEVATFGR